MTNLQGCVTRFTPLQNIIENIKESVFRSMNFTYKFCNLCEISGKEYSNDLWLYKIKGAEFIKNHHCAGDIQYHKYYKHFLDDINVYFEIQEKYFQNHSLDNMKLKFQRSNGDILEGTVVEGSGILYISSRDELGLYITFNVNGENLFKWIPFNNTYSKSLQKETKGLLSLNKELKDKELIIYLKEPPEWLKIERKEFIDIMKKHLDKIELKYLFSK